jgi:hypothetical protein
VHTFKRWEGESNATNWTQQLDTVRKKMVDLLKKTKFRMGKHSQVFNRVAPSYEGMKISQISKFGFSGERYTSNLNFICVEFHIVHQPCLELISVCSRLQSSGDLIAR